MRMIDKLAEEEKRRKQKTTSRSDEPDDMELEMELPLFGNLNTRKSAFDAGMDDHFGGINTAKSIFDRQAVFHVGRGD